MQNTIEDSEIEKLRAEIGASFWMNVSALSGTNVTQLFEDSIRAGCKIKSKTCSIL